jgi:Ca-activated chloride channel family protein
VGLIAFAGRSYLQAPLTTDHAAVVESLQALDTFTIPMGGTAISAALREAMDAFAKTKARSHGLVIISDGGQEDAELDSLLQKAKQKHIMIIAIGAGTEQGALIPDPDPDHQGDYIRDPETGNPVHTRLEEATLQKMAAETNGRYLRLGEKGLDKGLLLQTLSSLESMETGNREEVKPIERFYWPLSLGILSLMLSLLIRPAARLPRFSPAAVSAVLLLLAQGADASVLSLKETMDEARAAYQQQNFTRARDLYARLLSEDPPEGRAEEFAYGLGASSHQLKDYDRAIEAFSRALRSPGTDIQARSHYSLGNALYEQGAKALQQQPDFTVKAWMDSLSHYDAALTIKDDKAVRENYEFVRKKLEELQKKQEQQKQQSQKGDKKDKKDQKKGEKGEKGEPQDGESDPEESEKQGDKPGEKQDGKEKDGKQGKGEEQQPGEGEKIPEGQIKAGENGKPGEEQKEQQAMSEEMMDQKQDDRTGFSKNEARSLLRAYSDQMQLQFQQRQRDRAVKRDW